MLSKLSPKICLAISLFAVFVITVIDYYNGEYSLAAFYLVAILFSSWNTSRNEGYGITILAITGTFLSNYFSNMLSTPAQYWNLGVEATVMLLTCAIIISFRKHYDHEGYLARFDNLTGVSNRSNFYELAQLVLSQSKRYNWALTLAYIDLDNFKQVNDSRGHAAGDQVLTTVAATMKSTLREADIIARMGGDEFVVLFSETDYEEAKTVLTKLNDELLKAMGSMGYPVTFSIGAISSKYFAGTIDELLNIADKYLYTVKLKNKNGINHQEL